MIVFSKWIWFVFNDASIGVFDFLFYLWFLSSCVLSHKRLPAFVLFPPFLITFMSFTCWVSTCVWVGVLLFCICPLVFTSVDAFLSLWMYFVGHCSLLSPSGYICLFWDCFGPPGFAPSLHRTCKSDFILALFLLSNPPPCFITAFMAAAKTLKLLMTEYDAVSVC